MAPGARKISWRALARQVHLWLGLSLGVLMAVIGLTGSILVFYTDIDDALHPGAGLGLGALLEVLERLLQAGDLLLGFGQVVLERFAELVAPRRSCHLRQRLHQLLFGVIDVPQFVHERIVERLRLGHERISLGARHARRS